MRLRDLGLAPAVDPPNDDIDLNLWSEADVVAFFDAWFGDADADNDDNDVNNGTDTGVGLPGSMGRLRWYIDVSKWQPKDEHGDEFQFLLGLIQENERPQVRTWYSTDTAFTRPSSASFSHVCCYTPTCRTLGLL